MTPAFADYEFAPWAVADGKRVVAPDDEWDRVCTLPSGRIHVPVDVFEKWTSPMVDSRGHELFVTDIDDWWTEDNRNPDDVFDQLTLADVRDRSFDLMGQTQHLTWIVSTEHTANVLGLSPLDWVTVDLPKETPQEVRQKLKWPKIGFPSNLWLGARITDQRTADERIPHLLRVPAAVRWIDITPTSDIDLSRWFADVRQGEYMGTAHHARRPPKGWTRAINWVVVRGGDPVHLRSLRDQCQHAGVPFWCESAIDGKVYRELPTMEATP